jgi:hypothetical protein
MACFKRVLMILAIGVIQIFPDHNFITISTRNVGPGAIHRKIIEPKVPWTLDVLELDLTHPDMRIHSAKGNSINDRKTVSSFASPYEEKAIGGINGDFFNAYGSINAQVSDGIMVKEENINPENPVYWSAFSINRNNKPAISTNRFNAWITNGTDTLEIHGINRTAESDEIILYNHFYGSNPPAVSSGYGLQLSLTDDAVWYVKGQVSCVVSDVNANPSSLGILETGAVISATGTQASSLENLAGSDDPVTVWVGMDQVLPNTIQLVGGFPRIVKDGQNWALEGYAEEGGGSTFATEVHPRTAVGFSADSTRLFFVTVDGRQTSSRGMNLIELADFMISQGVAWGMNLDGGGSTTMLVRGNIENSPSDGSERSVINALIAVTDATPGELAHLQIKPDYQRKFYRERVSFKAEGWTENYFPHNISPDNITYTSSDTAILYPITANTFEMASLDKSAMVFTEYTDGSLTLRDTAYIVLKNISTIRLSPSLAMADTLTPLHFKVGVRDEDGLSQKLDLNEFIWTVTDPSIGYVDSIGTFYGLQEGSTKVIARFGNLADTALVTVKICEGTVVLNPMDDLSEWSVSGSYIDMDSTTLSIAPSPFGDRDAVIRADYGFIRLTTERSWLYLDTDIYINGIPDTIAVDVLSDGEKHKLYLIGEDINGNLFKTYISGYAEDTTRFVKMAFPADKFSAVDGDYGIVWPVRIKQIQVRLGTRVGADEMATGTLWFDNMRVIYPPLTAIENPHTFLPNTPVLYPNYPNPFNPVTTLTFSVPKSQHVTLNIYNIRGEWITTLLDRPVSPGTYNIPFDAGHYSSGIYFCRMTTGDATQTRKMALIK